MPGGDRCEYRSADDAHRVADGYRYSGNRRDGTANGIREHHSAGSSPAFFNRCRNARSAAALGSIGVSRRAAVRHRSLDRRSAAASVGRASAHRHDRTGGFVCRADPAAGDPTAILRAPSPVVRDGLVEVGRSAPVAHEPVPVFRVPLVDAPPLEEPEGISAPTAHVQRNSPQRTVIRRQSAWRRQTPRPGVAVASASPVMIAVPEPKAFLNRTDVRVAIATAVAVGSLMLGISIGRRQTRRQLSAERFRLRGYERVRPKLSDRAPRAVRLESFHRGQDLPRPLTKGRATGAASPPRGTRRSP